MQKLIKVTMVFQSTHPRRVRHPIGFLIFVNFLFQSTHPRRVRLQLLAVFLPINSFNPRTHVGCDLKFDRMSQNFSSFNPRTHVGCDVLLSLLFRCLILFQSTHPRRVRLHIQQKAEYQCAKIIILRKTAKKMRIKYHKRYIICKLLILRRCETIDYFAIL